MKCTRFFAVALALMLVWLPLAHAEEEHVFSYLPREGVTCVMQEEAETLVAPEGLESLYAFFAKNDPYATVCLFRMPNGRALLSVSCTEMEEACETGDLYKLKDLIADGLVRNMNGELAIQQEFRMDTVCGQPAMVLDAVLKGDGNTSLTAQAALFCRGRDLIEIWTAHPATLGYVFNPTAEKELKSDLKCMELLMGDFDFGDPYTEKDESVSTGEEPAEEIVPEEEGGLLQLSLDDAETDLPHVTITADDGLFRIDAPLDTIAIHQGTDADTVARARSLFAEHTGGGECFDLWYQDVVEQGCWLLVSREYGLGVHISADQTTPYLMQPEQLAQLEQPVLETLQELYDTATVADETAAITLDGKDHVWFSYHAGKAGMNLLTYVITAADGTGLYEIDVYLSMDTGKDSDELSQMVIQLLQSLDYLPETQL